MIALGWLVFGPAIFLWFRNIAAIDFWSEGNILKTERNFMESCNIPMYCEKCNGSVKPNEIRLLASKSLVVFGHCLNCGVQQNFTFSLIDLWAKCPSAKEIEDGGLTEKAMEASITEKDHELMKEMGFSMGEEDL